MKLTNAMTLTTFSIFVFLAYAHLRVHSNKGHQEKAMGSVSSGGQTVIEIDSEINVLAIGF